MAELKRKIDPYFKDIPSFNSISKKLKEHEKKISLKSKIDLEDERIYDFHARIVRKIGQHYMDRENKKFVIDDLNKGVLKFLLYYFNGCKLACDVFPEEDYALHKNIILCGDPGTGKTIFMQIFADYLKMTGNSRFFQNQSVSQMMNYNKINSHIDKFTFNEINSKSREGSPFDICMHDIGIKTQDQKHFGTDGKLIIDEFLYSRYDIFQSQGINYHLTTNMPVDEFKEKFEDRLIDRFKSFNVIPLTGKSRR